MTPCDPLVDKNDKIVGIVCYTPLYRYKGFAFEYGPERGLWRCRADGEPWHGTGVSLQPEFWAAIDEWMELSDKEKEKTRI